MIRREELVNISFGDLSLTDGILRVFGKGRKERVVPVGMKTVKQINLYVRRYRRELPGDHLFCLSSGARLSRQHCYQIVRRIGQNAGIHLNPHLIRHSAATQFIANGGSIAILQKILGHTSPVVTEKYLHLAEEHLRHHYRSLSPSGSLKIKL